MTDSYSWKVNTLEHNVSDGSVFVVHWSVAAERSNPNASGEVYLASSYGSTGFTADPSDPNFVEYNALTEGICISWVQDAIGPESVASIESGLSNQLDEKETPTTSAGVPW
jgi:hypothetical protein